MCESCFSFLLALSFRSTEVHIFMWYLPVNKWWWQIWKGRTSTPSCQNQSRSVKDGGTISERNVSVLLSGHSPSTSDNKYIVTLVDYFSKWPEAEALPDKSAKGVALFLYNMICREHPGLLPYCIYANCKCVIHFDEVWMYQDCN